MDSLELVEGLVWGCSAGTDLVCETLEASWRCSAPWSSNYYVELRCLVLVSYIRL